MAGGTDDATALAIAGFVTSMLTSDHAAGLSALERALSSQPVLRYRTVSGGGGLSLNPSGPAMTTPSGRCRLEPI